MSIAPPVQWYVIYLLAACNAGKSNSFTGSIRSNLDPFSQHDDARLWDALRRSYLIEAADATPVDGGEVANKNRFTLDTTVEAEGANLSVGERSLLSLARALVKDSKVVGT